MRESNPSRVQCEAVGESVPTLGTDEFLFAPESLTSLTIPARIGLLALARLRGVPVFA